MPDNRSTKMTRQELDFLAKQARLLEFQNKPARERAKARAKTEAEFDKLRREQGQKYVDLVIKYYDEEIERRLARYEDTNYADLEKRADKIVTKSIEDERNLLDPRKRDAGLARLRQAVTADRNGGMSLLGQVYGGDITDRQEQLARYDLSDADLPDVVAIAAGLDPDELGLFDSDDYDDMYEAFEADPREFDELVAGAADAEAERLWALVEPTTTGMAGSDTPDRIRESLRDSLRSRAYREAELRFLRDSREEAEQLKETVAAAKSANIPFEQIFSDSFFLATQRAAPFVDAGLTATPEQAQEQVARIFSEEERADLESRYGQQATQVLEGMDPRARMSAMSMLDMQRSNLNPMTSALLDYMDRVQKAPTDPAFVQWRSARGIPSNQPVTVGEYNRYQRQARKVGRGTFKAKKTGAIRSIEYADKSFAFDGGPMGALYFTNDKDEYLTPEQVQERAEADLAGANVVEFALSGNDEVLTRVGNAIVGAGGEDVGAFLQKLAGTPASDRVRMRVLFDKKTGDIVVLDKDRKVEFSGRATDDSEDLAMLYRLAEDPAMADVAGSGSDLAKAKAGNAVKTLAGVKKGSKFDAGPYVPTGTTLRTEPPKTTVVGEVVNIPGADPRYAYVMQEVGGEKRTVKVPLADVLDHHDFKDVSAFAEAVGADPEDRAVQRMWGRAERKKGRSKRIKERASKRAPLGAKSTATAGAFGALPELAAREKPKRAEEKKASTPEAQALGGDVDRPRIVPTDEAPDYGAVLDPKRLGTSEQDMSIESLVSPDEPSVVGQWEYTQLPHFGGRPEDNRLYPQASLAERLSEAWEGNFGDKKDEKKPKK